MKNTTTGIIGSGAMGSGIAQIAATNGHHTYIVDTNPAQLEKCRSGHQSTFDRLVEKGKISLDEARAALSRLTYTTQLGDLASCGLIIEAIVENHQAKADLLRHLESIVGADCVLGTNTSSLSVTALAGACQRPERVVGIHFFNPAPLMPLVEIVPALQTDDRFSANTLSLIQSWGKTTVVAKDTPGFIVNRVARPFYSEAIRIYEEGIGTMAQIDSAMRHMGFRMGPFELMDFIGNDVNLAVTRTVWEAMFFDPRYRPSLTQQKLVEAGRFGRKSGRGYYDYANGAAAEQAPVSPELQEKIGMRILAMLINEAADALHLGVASARDLDLAMTRGVNYPKGLLAWGDELSPAVVRTIMNQLYVRYQEDRYRCSPLITDCVDRGVGLMSSGLEGVTIG